MGRTKIGCGMAASSREPLRELENRLRLVTWNCRIGGYRWKSEHMAALLPDVLTVQEVTNSDEVLVFAGKSQPTYAERIASAPSARGIGVYSYTGTSLVRADPTDEMWGFVRYEVQRGDLEFHVVAVWTWNTGEKQTKYRQAVEGLRAHQKWIRQRPAVIMGDFNDNASYRLTDIREILDLAESLGLVSAYHHHSSEPFGEETKPTHYHHAKRESPFHLDYCFLPRSWAERIAHVEVGSYDDWHQISDHVPVIVDLHL